MLGIGDGSGSRRCSGSSSGSILHRHGKGFLQVGVVVVGVVHRPWRR
jgi:hypothetical protein